jgi:hypothetical protein
MKNSMEGIPFAKAGSRLAIKKLPSFYEIVHYTVLSSLQVGYVLSQMNPLHILTDVFYKICFSIIH